MTIIDDLQTIIDGAEEGFFSIDDLKDIVEKEKGQMKTLGELIKSAKELIIYDEEDDMWGYDEERWSNPPLDAMDLIVHIATLDEN
jgi:hypothetical protein